MSEMKNRWRCPYCDGLNDWENAVCEICGDGKRDEFPREPAMPKTYTPPTREPAKPETPPPGRGRRPTPSPRKKKKGGWFGKLLCILLILGLLAAAFITDGDNGYLSSAVEWGRTMLEKLAPTEAPAISETEAPTASVTEAPTPTPEPTEAPAPGDGEAADEADSDEPLSIVYNGDGTVTLYVANGSDYAGWAVSAVWLGESPDEENLIDYDASDYSPLNRATGYGDGSVRLGVATGGYTSFILEPFNSEYTTVWRWKTDPIYFPANTGTDALSVDDARLCLWPDIDALNRASEALATACAEGDATASIGLSELPLDSAGALNAALTAGGSKNMGDWPSVGLYIDYRTDFDMDGYVAWKLGDDGADHAPLTVLLTGPGFSETFYGESESVQYILDGRGQELVDFDLLSQLYLRLPEDMDGYPPGDYRLDLYLRGAKVYTLGFTLDEQSPSVAGGWDFQAATDDELKNAMELYFSGRDEGGGGQSWCALFMDASRDHGGVLTQGGSSVFLSGTLTWRDSDGGSGEAEVLLTEPDGAEHSLWLRTDDGGTSYLLLSVDDLSFDDLRLEPNSTLKTAVYDALKAMKSGESAEALPTLAPEQAEFSLALGDRGGDVRTLQESLITIGFLTGRADGIFGTKTEEAVRAAQEAMEYEQTGVADYYTFEAINTWAEVLR